MPGLSTVGQASTGQGHEACAGVQAQKARASCGIQGRRASLLWHHEMLGLFAAADRQAGALHVGHSLWSGLGTDQDPMKTLNPMSGSLGVHVLGRRGNTGVPGQQARLQTIAWPAGETPESIWPAEAEL
eukprot:361986-Chlamydomonas_euryale.AAC.1